MSRSTGAGFHDRMRGGEFDAGLCDAVLACDNLLTVLMVGLEAGGGCSLNLPMALTRRFP